MFSEDVRAAYKRLLVFVLLSVCLLVFGLAEIESVFAGVCIQDCEASESRCQDSCAPLCSTTDENCNDCFANCDTQLARCMRGAVYCSAGSNPYNPECSVEYADHCPIINGQVSCTDPSAHSGYYQICNRPGGGACVSCPGQEYCTGSGGLPPCF